MMSRSMLSLVALFGVLLLAASTLYIIKETERGVLLRWGKIEKGDLESGLHIKVPVMDQVRKFDARVMTLDARPESFFTIENKRLTVDSYAKWRISEVEKYYIATSGDESIARNLLEKRINDGLRNQFGKRTLHEVVSGERDQLMTELTASLNEIALQALGVEVVDIRVKRIDLPTEVGQSVFLRMAAGREREAREHRSRGKELAEGIRADADRQSTLIEAEAYRDAELIRGDGDATAAAIYAQAYKKNPEFYAFLRRLNAYKESFKDKGDILLLDSDSDFFKYLNDLQGDRR